MSYSIHDVKSKKLYPVWILGMLFMEPVIQAIYLFIYFIFKFLCNFYVNGPVTYLLILLL